MAKKAAVAQSGTALPCSCGEGRGVGEHLYGAPEKTTDGRATRAFPYNPETPPGHGMTMLQGKGAFREELVS